MLLQENLVSIIFIVFLGAAIFSTLALYTKQSLLVAYIMVGVVAGPWGLHLIQDASLTGPNW